MGGMGSGRHWHYGAKEPGLIGQMAQGMLRVMNFREKHGY